MADALAAFKSSGLSILNETDSAGPAERTIIVVGVPRSGTSMIASSLRAMNIFVGDRADRSVHEDVEMALAIEGGNRELLQSLIRERDQSHQVWGFKRPAAFRHLLPLLAHFRNPRFVVPFRDSAAIAKRNEISMRMDFSESLMRAAKDNLELTEFVTKLQAPALLVSYEKALQHPGAYAETLAAFCGVTLAKDLRSTIEATVENGPAAYLAASRLQFEGAVDRVEKTAASGWARLVGQSKPQTVSARIDGQRIGSALANIFRADLEKAGKEAGFCSFKMTFSKNVEDLKRIEFFVEGTNYKLGRATVQK